MNHLRVFLFFFLILLIACGKEEFPNDDCSILNPFSFSSYPSKGGINVTYDIRSIVDGIGRTCYPEKLEFSISDNGSDYRKIATVAAKEGSLLIDNLEDCKEYYVKMVNFHSELDPVTIIQSAFVGDIPLPKFMDSPSWITDDYFEAFRLSPSGRQLIIRNNANDWFVTSLDDSNIEKKVAENAYYAQWNPQKAAEIAVVENIYIDSLSGTSVRGITSKRLVAIDVNTAARTILHEITNHWDYGHDSLNTELYWIHEFHYSVDGDAIYFVSNKDNGAINLQEKSSYNNIWKLDLQTKEIEPLSDLLPLDIKLHAFTEDPKQKGNFYLTGYSSASQKASIYYYNTPEKMLSPVHQLDRSIGQLSIDPLGENLLYTSNSTGEDEIWRYNLLTNQFKQITSSNTYYPSSNWFHSNWMSDNEFLTLLKHNNKNRFAVFSVR